MAMVIEVEASDNLSIASVVAGGITTGQTKDAGCLFSNGACSGGAHDSFYVSADAACPGEVRVEYPQHTQNR